MILLATVDGNFFRAISATDETIDADKTSITSDVGELGILALYIMTEQEFDDFEKLYLPILDGTAWVEGMSQAEIDAIQNAVVPPTSDERLSALEEVMMLLI